jgi:hypothetical protein
MSKPELFLFKFLPVVMRFLYRKFYYQDMIRALKWLDGRGEFTAEGAVAGFSSDLEWSRGYAIRIFWLLGIMGWIGLEPKIHYL